VYKRQEYNPTYPVEGDYQTLRSDKNSADPNEVELYDLMDAVLRYNIFRASIILSLDQLGTYQTAKQVANTLASGLPSYLHMIFDVAMQGAFTEIVARASESRRATIEQGGLSDTYVAETGEFFDTSVTSQMTPETVPGASEEPLVAPQLAISDTYVPVHYDLTNFGIGFASEETVDAASEQNPFEVYLAVPDETLLYERYSHTYNGAILCDGSVVHTLTTTDTQAAEVEGVFSDTVAVAGESRQVTVELEEVSETADGVSDEELATTVVAATEEIVPDASEESPATVESTFSEAAAGVSAEDFGATVFSGLAVENAPDATEEIAAVLAFAESEETFEYERYTDLYDGVLVCDGSAVHTGVATDVMTLALEYA
jgi:hypothetical protein